MLTPPLTFSRSSEAVKRTRDRKKMMELLKRKLKQRLLLKHRLRLTQRSKRGLRGRRELRRKREDKSKLKKRSSRG